MCTPAARAPQTAAPCALGTPSPWLAWQALVTPTWSLGPCSRAMATPPEGARLLPSPFGLVASSVICGAPLPTAPLSGAHGQPLSPGPGALRALEWLGLWGWAQGLTSTAPCPQVPELVSVLRSKLRDTREEDILQAAQHSMYLLASQHCAAVVASLLGSPLPFDRYVAAASRRGDWGPAHTRDSRVPPVTSPSCVSAHRPLLRWAGSPTRTSSS